MRVAEHHEVQLRIVGERAKPDLLQLGALVGGFFLVDVGSRDEAIAIARDCPAARWATVEVRAVGPCFT